MGFPGLFPFILPGGDPYDPEIDPFGDLTYESDHAGAAVDLLLQQFKGLPLIEGMIESYANRVQELENALWDILIASDIDQAAAGQLDGLGSLVGEGRADRGDTEYRAAIRIRILINRCNGRHAEMLRILMLYLNADTGNVALRDRGTAGLSLNVYVDVPSDPANLRVIAYTIKPAGVNLDGRYETSATRPYRFGWSGGAVAGQTSANADGWSGDATVGGLLAARI